jgi:hypothetical protein
MPFSSSYPKSSTTETLIERFARWMRLRDDGQSVGALFVNAFAQQLDQVSSDQSHLTHQAFSDRMDLDQPAWLYKARIPGTQEIPIPVSISTSSGSMEELESIIQMRQSRPSDRVCLIDRQHRLIYCRTLENSVTLAGQTLTQSDFSRHHLWNPIDETALHAGLSRRHGEENLSLWKRAVYSFTYPPSTTRLGLIHALGVNAGLLVEQIWDESEATLPLSHSDFIPETVLIDRQPILPGQLVDDTLLTEVKPLFMDGWELDGLQLQNGSLTLTDGVLEGTAVLSMIRPGNLSEWTGISLTPISGATVRFADADAEAPAQWRNHFHEQSAWTKPLRLFVRLSRVQPSDPSPELNSLTLQYEPQEATVSFIYGLEVDALHDPAFLDEMFDRDGQPNDELLGYLKTLRATAPVLWDEIHWDEGHWDVFDAQSTGVAWLPRRWDASAQLDDSLLRTGIGDGQDLQLTEIDADWRPVLRDGFVYVGSPPQEYYHYVEPEQQSFTTQTQIVLTKQPTYGAPILVRALDGETWRDLTQVAFLEDNQLSLTYQGEVEAQGDLLILPHTNIDPDTLVLSRGAVSSIDENKVCLTQDVQGRVEVSYRIQDSFLFIPGDEPEIHLSASYDEGEILYESSQLRERSYPYLTVDPAELAYPRGFVYWASQDEPVQRLVLSMAPDEFCADGADYGVLTIEAYDVNDNPVALGEDPLVQVSYGSFSNPEVSGHTATLRYYAPALSSNLPMTIAVTATVQGVAESTTITLR